jgi:hypothetical protein
MQKKAAARGRATAFRDARDEPQKANPTAKGTQQLSADAWARALEASAARWMHSQGKPFKFWGV